MKNKTVFNKLMLGIVILMLCHTSYSQTPIFDDEIIINETYSINSEIFPFSGETLFGLGVSGTVTFNSDVSVVRVIVSDAALNEYLIYETYPMLENSMSFTFTEEADETAFLDGFQPTKVIIEINDASLYIDQLELATGFVDNAGLYQQQLKTAKDNEKITEINAYIQGKGMIWLAAENNYSNLFYSEKKECCWWPGSYSTFGYEFYKGGIFEIFGMMSTDMCNPDYDVIDHFDYRYMHGANNPDSPYYDGDINGSGWMTEPKCQTGCWHDGFFHCISEDDCNSLGGIWRITGACTGFAAVGVTEGHTNLYFNQHLDLDLSEQQMASFPGQNNQNCAGVINGGQCDSTIIFVHNTGLADEQSFPFEGINVPCDNMIWPPYELIKFDDYHEGTEYTSKAIKKTLIENGPLSWCTVIPNAESHAVVFVGYNVIKEGDIIDLIGTIPPYSGYIGLTYWIFKDSGGLDHGNNGYDYVFLYDAPSSYVSVPMNTPEAVTSLHYTDDDRLCRDYDDDGYFNWGLGLKPPDCPSCPDVKDGNDADYSIGPVDENGFYTIINDYTISFEDDFYGWRQSGEDDLEWKKHEGLYLGQPDLGPNSAQNGDFYLYFWDNDPPELYKTAIFESPLINFDVQCSYNISFWYYRFVPNGGDESRFEVQFSNDGGQSWYTALYEEGNNTWQDNYWKEASFTVYPLVNKIRFIQKAGLYPQYCEVAIDNISFTEQNTPGDFVIQGNHVWNNEYYPCGDIIIEPNSSLTLKENCILHMDAGRKIIVKRIGELIVDGGTITDAGNGMWAGVEVWGENGAPSNNIYQGLVSLKNTATIKNAICGIKNTRTDDVDESIQGEYSGGIVHSSNSLFINNKTAIEFYAFGPEGSKSGMSRTTFEVNDQLYPEVNVQCFVKMIGIKGISIAASVFQDLRLSVPIENKATGIYSVNAGYTVQAICVSPTIPCQDYEHSNFNNLRYGIRALGINSSRNITVRRTDFSNCPKGVYASGIDNLLVLFSDFETHPLASASFPSYGLYLETCTGYTIEENTFHNDQAGNRGIGMVVYNSGSAPNEIYLNSFDNLEYAAIAQGYNAGNTTGLQFLCNHFNDCTMDIAVTGSGVLDGSIGIAQNQGAFSTTAEYMAGNVFFYNSIPNDFDDLYNEGRHFNYYYADDAEDYTVEPMDANWDRVTKTGMYTTETWDYLEHCPSNQNGNGITMASSSVLLADIAENEQKIDSTQNLLSLLVDGGDTDESLLDVILSMPPETMEIYTELMGDAPYVSDTVMASAIEKENVLPNAMIRDIMVASPQTSKSDMLMHKLDERLDPLPDYMKAEILQGKSIVAAMEETESVLAFYQKQKARSFNQLINLYANDTINPQLSSDSITLLLQNDGELSSKYKLAFHYFELGQMPAASIVLSDIPFDFDLGTNQQTLHQEITDYFSWLSLLPENGHNFITIDSNLQTQLWDQYYGDSYLAPVYVRNILLARDECTYSEPIVFPDLLKAHEAVNDYNNLLDTKPPEYLSVFPNPSRNYVIIEYNHGVAGHAEIKIFRMSGIPVQSFAVYKAHDQLVVDTRMWESGTYIVNLIVNNKSIESSVFSIVH